MTQKVSLIKWSNSFPGIVSIVYTEYPALVLYAIDFAQYPSLYDSSHLSQPGKFYEIDPNREHRSQQYFNDSVVCMDWGHNEYSDCLAFGLENGWSVCSRWFEGDVIVRPCKGGIFKEEVYSKIHDLQKQSCISVCWRHSTSHVSVDAFLSHSLLSDMCVMKRPIVLTSEISRHERL